MKLSAFVALGLLLIQSLVLPRVVEAIAKSALADLGYPDARFRVSGATYFGTQLVNLELGEEGEEARAAAIGVDYSPWSLVHGRVKTVRIAGAELAIAIRGNTVDLGVLGLGKTRTEAPEGSSAAPSTARPAAPISLPLDRLELRGCTLAVDWEGRQLWIPVEGGVASPGAGAVHLALDVRLQGALAKVDASFASANQFDVMVKAEGLSVAALAAALPAQYTAQYPVVGSGAMDATARYTQAGEARKTSASVTLDGVRLFALVEGHRLLVGELDGGGSIELDSAFGLADVAFNGGMKRLAFDAMAARDVALKVVREDQVLRVDVSAAGDDWRLKSLVARLGGVLGGAPGAALTAEADVHVEGHPPIAIREQMKESGWDIEKAGVMSVKGRIEAGAAEAGDWFAWTRGMEIELGEGDIVLTPAGVLFGGANARLSIDADIDSAGMSVHLAESSRVAVGSFRQSVAGYALEKVDAKGDQVSLVVEGKPVELKVGWKEKSWAVTAPALRLEVPSSRLRLTGGAAAENMRAVLRLRMDAGSGEFALHALDGSTMAFDSMHQPVGDDVLRTGPWRIVLASEQGEPMLSTNSTARGSVTRLNMTGLGEGPLSGRSRDIHFDAGRVEVVLDATFDEGPAAIRAAVDLQETSASYKPADLLVGKLNARIPFAWNMDVQERGGVHIEGARVGMTEIPPIDGALAMSGTLLKLSASSTVLDAGKLQVSGQLDLAGGKVRGVLDAQVPPFELADATALARMAPALDGYDVTGTLAARAKLELTSIGVQPRLELSISDGRLHNPESGWLVEGIDVGGAGGAGANPLVIDSLSPLATPGGQRITVDKVTMNKVVLSEGLLTFRIESPDLVFVEGTEWGWAGGRLYSNAFRFDRRAGRVEAVISADRLRLEQILPVFTDRVTGEGAVYGRLPISVRWPQGTENKIRVVDWNRPMVFFGEGFVYATPGGGRLQIKDTEQLLGAQLNQLLAANPQLAKAGMLEQVRARILRAMGDLDYDVLKLDLVRQGDAPDAPTSGRAFMSGKEHGVAKDPVPLGGITVLVDFDRLIRSVMGLQQRLGQ